MVEIEDKMMQVFNLGKKALVGVLTRGPQNALVPGRARAGRSSCHEYEVVPRARSCRAKNYFGRSPCLVVPCQ